MTSRMKLDPELQHENGRSFSDIVQYIKDFELSEQQSDGLLNLLRQRYPAEGYPQSTWQLSEETEEISCIWDPLVVSKEEEVNYASEATEEPEDATREDSPVPKLGRSISWEGFSKVYDERLRRNIALCHGCCALIKNSTRLQAHREKCGELDASSLLAKRSLPEDIVIETPIEPEESLDDSKVYHQDIITRTVTVSVSKLDVPAKPQTKWEGNLY